MMLSMTCHWDDDHANGDLASGNGAILSLAAGGWGWPQGWVFLSEVAVSTFAVTHWLALDDHP